MKKVNLVGALERGIDKMKPENEWNEQKIHVSDLSVALNESDRKCHRALWLRYYDYEKQERNAGTKLMFLQGDRLHSMAAELLDKGLNEWDITGIETNISEGLPDGITGRTDLIMDNGIQSMIVDFKTVRGNAFNYLHEPKESHKLQVRTYMYATGADYGAVLYVDREGQNFARQFFVEENHLQVENAINQAKNIIDMDKPPQKMTPKIKTRENKGDDAVYCEMPWQCQYCDYLDVSCDGALPEKFRENKVKGYIGDEGFYPKDKYKGIEDYVEVS